MFVDVIRLGFKECFKFNEQKASKDVQSNAFFGCTVTFLDIIHPNHVQMFWTVKCELRSFDFTGSLTKSNTARSCHM